MKKTILGLIFLGLFSGGCEPPKRKVTLPVNRVRYQRVMVPSVYVGSPVSALSPFRIETEIVKPPRSGMGVDLRPDEGDPVGLEGKALVRPLPPPVQLVDETTRRGYMAYWPKTDQSFYNDLRDSAVFYNQQTTPAVYQTWDEGPKNSGFVFAESGNKGKNANLEFPWNATAGMHTVSDSRAIHAINFGKPMRWFRYFDTKGRFDGWGWEYGEGTTLTELLLMNTRDGIYKTFESRHRTKKADGTWEMEVFRPFPTEQKLESALKRIGYTLPNIDGFLETLQSNNRFESTGGLVSPAMFTQTAVTVKAPSMTSDMVRKLLDDNIFSSAVGRAYRHYDGVDCFAPRADGLSIVPAGFSGGFVRADSKSCMRCHVDCGQVVVEPGDRRWRVRGSDAIFTFSPFDFSEGQQRFHPSLVAAGLLVHKEGAP